MKKINMLSHHFAHAKSSTWYKEVNNFSWDFNSKQNDLSFYIDKDVTKGIKDKNDGKKKFLWTLESNFFNDNVFEFIEKNLDEVLDTYEMIFTYNDKLCELNKKFKWVPAMGYWVLSPSIGNKTKTVSMIASQKKITPQQQFRFDFANKNKNNLDLYGHGFNSINQKEDGLLDYMFSICIENDTFDTYFTEKILDCFATGTIPVYKGTRNISKHFNTKGILFLDDISIDKLNKDLYLSKLDYVNENFQKVLNYNTVEDWIYNEYLKFYF
jgi:hypothetical protein